MGRIKLPKTESSVIDSTLEVNFDGETGEVSDGYHTFNELYDHRIELFITLCRVIHHTVGADGGYLKYKVWRSTTHSDGSQIPDGWFLLGIGKENGQQISYHIPAKRWHDTDFVLREHAPKFDGHTSADVLERLKQL